MDVLALAQGTPTDPGGNWGAILAVVSALSVIATYIAGTLLQRRRGKSDFTGEVIKEMDFWKAKAHDEEKKRRELDDEIIRLNNQNRILGRENAMLIREEHKEVLERLEALITRAEVSRVGETGTHSKLDEIHNLVNDRLDDALRKLEAQGTQLAVALKKVETLELRLRQEGGP